MSRYTGPRARVSRRLGTNIFGTRGEEQALEKRPYPPGVHGRTRRRTNGNGEYLEQLQARTLYINQYLHLPHSTYTTIHGYLPAVSRPECE